MATKRNSKLRNAERYRTLFNEFDADNNGYLSITEFRNLLKSADSNLQDSQIADFFLFFDGPKGDRRITYKEFSKGLDQLDEYMSLARTLFHEYDSSGDGFLDRNELRKLLGDLGCGKLTSQEVDQILREADKNGDGKISLDEFLDACC